MKKMTRHSPVRLGRARKLLVYFVCSGVWLSGGLWLLFHYFLTTRGDFGAQANPLEPWWLKLHGAFAFASIWLFGLLWGVHITTAWPVGRRRRSGVVLTTIFFWLIVSGYLLYYVGGETVRPVISLLHWTIGLGAPLAFLGHRWKRRKKVRRALPKHEAEIMELSRR